MIFNIENKRSKAQPEEVSTDVYDLYHGKMKYPALDRRIIEQFNSRAPFKLHEATIVVLCRMGSHSHNTYIPPDDPTSISDIDYMGVIIPPLSYTLGLREWDGLRFQYEDLDVEFYSFRKFVSLLVKSNPNVIGTLWLRHLDYVFFDNMIWNDMLEHRSLFSSLKAYPSFMGYAQSQLSKMTSFDIITQNEWDQALSVIEKCGWDKETIINKDSARMPPKDAGYTKDETDWAIQTIRKIHARHFQGYMGEKRKGLVRKYGYDTKNAAHLIRLMLMCCEYLETGELQVFRTTDADYIRDIKAGKYQLEDIQAKAQGLFVRADQAKDTSPLPPEPDIVLINELVVASYLRAYGLGPPAMA